MFVGRIMKKKNLMMTRIFKKYIYNKIIIVIIINYFYLILNFFIFDDWCKYFVC